MSRHLARNILLQLVYAFNVSGERDDYLPGELLAEAGIRPDDEEFGFVSRLYGGIVSGAEELKAEIASFAEGFALERIFKVDLSILMIAAYELRHVPEIPTAASINEAVQLSKIYSTEKSGSFINGILAKIAVAAGKE